MEHNTNLFVQTDPSKKNKQVYDPIQVNLNTEKPKNKQVYDDSISYNFNKDTEGSINEFGTQPIPTGGFEALRRQRAENQSTGRQIANASGQLIPAIALGIAENAGYLLDLPQSLFGDQKDYTNDIVEWSKARREDLSEALPIYRENPDQVWDMSDPAWWINNGLGLAESIGEFLVTGAGVGGALSKSAKLAQVISTSQKVGRVAQLGAQSLTAATLAYTEGAMSGSEIYKQVYQKVLDESGDADLANEEASNAASKTVRLNTEVNTLLNLTGIAPLFAKNSPKYLRSGFARNKGELASDYKNRLLTQLDELKQINPSIKDNLLREALQEGVEEQVNLIAEIEGKLEGGLVTKDEVGKTLGERIRKAITSDEGTLNFALGALGGVGQTAGMNIIGRNNRADAAKLDFDNKNEQLLSRINLLDATDKLRKQLTSHIQSGNLQEAEKVKNELFSIVATDHVKRGTGDAIIGSLEEILQVDNVKDLGEQLQPERDRIFAELQELQSQEDVDPEVLAQKVEEYKAIVQQQNQLIGKTQAMYEGLADSQKDNNYRLTAQSKINEINDLQKKYDSFVDRFNSTEQGERYNLAGHVLDSYNTFKQSENDLNAVRSADADFMASINTQIDPNHASQYLLEGEIAGLKNLKELYKKFPDQAIIPEELALPEINRLLKEKEEALGIIPDKVTSDKNIVDKISEEKAKLQYKEIVKNQLEKDYNEFLNDKTKGEKYINSKLQERKRLEEEERKVQEKEVNKPRKKVSEVTSKAKKLSEKDKEKLNPQQKAIIQKAATMSETDEDIDRTAIDINSIINQVSSDEEIRGDIKEPYSEKKSFTENPSDRDKVIAPENKKDLNEQPDSGYMLVHAGVAIANRFKGDSIDGRNTKTNDINPNYPTILVTGQVKVGDKITLEIDKEFKDPVADTTEFEEISKLPNDEFINKVPIRIIRNGEKIGYLHRMDYINENNVVASTDILEDNLSAQREILLNLRKQIVDKGKIDTTISMVGGESAISKNVNGVEKSTIIPKDVAIGVIGIKGIESAGRLVATDNSEDFITENQGRVVFILPKINGLHRAAPVSINTISEEDSQTIADVVSAYLLGNDKALVDTIKEKIGYDVSSRKGIEEFLSDYVFLHYHGNEERLSIASMKGDNKMYLSIEKGKIFTQQKGVAAFEFNAQNINDNIKRLKEDLQQMFYNVDKNKIGKSFNYMFKLEDGTYEVSKESYDSRVRDITMTNIQPNYITHEGKEYVTYFDNPMFYIQPPFDVSEIVDKYSRNKKKKVVEERPITTSLEDLVKQAEGLSLGEFKGKTERKRKRKDYDPIDVNDQNLMGLLKAKLLPKISTPIDVTYEIVDAIYVEMVYELRKGNKFPDLAIRNKYQNQLNNFDEYLKLAVKKLSVLEEIEFDEDLNIEGLEDQESIFEKTKFNDDYNFSVDNKKSASSLLKRFLSIVPEINRDGTAKSGIFAKNLYVPIDSVFNTLKTVLADTEPSYEAMIEKLEQHENNVPWLSVVIDRLEDPTFEEEAGVSDINDIEQIRNQFVTMMSNAQYEFKTLVYDANTGSHRIISSDRYSNFRLILNKWRENLKNSKLVDRTKDSYKLSRTEIDKLIKRYDDFIEQKHPVKSVESKEFLKSFLQDIGVEIDDITIDRLVTKNILDYKNKVFNPMTQSNEPTVKYSVGSLYKPKGLIGSIYSRLKDTSEEKDSEFEVSNPLFNNSAIENIARIESKLNTNIYSSSFLNVEGNNIVSINLNREFTRRDRELRTTEYAKRLVNLPFNRSNQDTWLNMFANKNDNFLNVFNLEVLNGVTGNEYSDKGKVPNKLSPRELEGSKIMFYVNSNDKDVGRFVHFVPSKNTTFIFKAPKIKNIQIDNDNNINEPTVDILYSIVESEIQRINEVDIYGKKGKKFYFFDTLNDLEYQDKNGNTFKLIQDDKVYITPDSEIAIRNHIKDQMKLMIASKVGVWKNLGIIKDDKLTFIPNNITNKNNPNKFAAEYLANQMWFQYNMFQSFIGDMAQFGKNSINASWDEAFKRFTKDQAPGLDIRIDKDNLQYVQVALKDRKVDSKYLENIPEEYKSYYQGIESTDAQEYTTVQEHLYLLKQLGKISSNDYDRVLRRTSSPNAVLQEEDLKILFIPMKPVATGKRIIESNGQPVAEITDYVKSSSLPLVPQFTSGLAIDKLRRKLEKLQKDKGMFVRASYQTANKLGLDRIDVTPIDIFQGDFNIEDGNYAILNRSGFRIQQEVPFKEENYVVDGTQQRKLIQLGLSPFVEGIENKEEILERYNSLYKQMYDENYKSFIQKFSNEEGIIDINKLQSFLVDEAIKRKWNQNDIKSLELTEDGRFKIPLYYNNSGAKVEAMLSSLINNNILKNKRKGTSGVLVSQEKFEGFAENIIYSPNYDGELKPARFENNVFKPAQVLVSKSLFKDITFKKITNEDRQSIIQEDQINNLKRLENNFNKDIDISFIENEVLKNQEISVKEIFDTDDDTDDEIIDAVAAQNLIKKKYRLYEKLNQCLRDAYFKR